LNKSEAPVKIRLEIKDRKIKSVAQAWELFGKNGDDCNPVWQPLPLQKDFEHLLLKGSSISLIKYRLE
jgi:hypothetical protein